MSAFHRCRKLTKTGTYAPGDVLDPVTLAVTSAAPGDYNGPTLMNQGDVCKFCGLVIG